MQTEPFDAAARAYVEAHFLPLDALAEAAGAEPSRVTALIADRIAPGAIYRRDPERGWWSALGGWVDGGEGAPAGGGEAWFSPWAVWGFRTALWAERQGVPAACSAQSAVEGFRRDFVDALATVKSAQIAFPGCFDVEGKVDRAAAMAAAEAEWKSWLRGGYAVCLRVFTAETCVRKETLGALLKRHVADPQASPMTTAESLEACAALASIMLPFAPWERPGGTPGRTIDPLLARHALGRERPYR